MKKNLMKITMCMLICITMIIINGVIPVEAVDKNNDKLDQREKLVKKYYGELIQLGFPKKNIERLAPEEIEYIVKNRAVFKGETTTHSLYIKVKDKNLNRSNGYMMIGLTKEELKEYLKDSKKIVSKKIKEMYKEKSGKLQKLLNDTIDYEKTEIEIKSLDGNTFQLVYASENQNPSTTNLDFGVLELKINNYDTYTSGMYKRTIGLEFEWLETPVCNFEDGFGFAIGGDWWASYGGGGYYYTTIGGMSDLIEYNRTVEGCTAKVNIPNSQYQINLEFYGRIYNTLGNYSQHIPSNFIYTVYADYYHSIINISGWSLAIEDTGIGINNNFGTKLIPANQATQNYTTPIK